MIVDLGENTRPFRVVVQPSGSSSRVRALQRNERGEAWVTTRGTGEVVRLGVADGEIRWRRTVCREPRGLARTPDGRVGVACAGGEFVVLDHDGRIIARTFLAPDLRDVVHATRRIGDVLGEDVFVVTRFRSAEVLVIEADSLAVIETESLGPSARVAWRARPYMGGMLVLHDEVSTDPVTVPPPPEPEVEVPPPYYGSASPGPTPTCAALHQPRFTWIDPMGSVTPGAMWAGLALPVDFVVDQWSSLSYLVAGGSSGRSLVKGLASVYGSDPLFDRCMATLSSDPGEGTPAAVASSAYGDYLVVQYANPFSVTIQYLDSWTWRVAVWPESTGTPAVGDRGFSLFHMDPGSGIACASCHPEGLDDGNVWEFDESVDGVIEEGPRATPTLAPAIVSRAPYHWMGEHPTAADLVSSTFTARMGGPEVAAEDVDALFGWLEGLRPVRATVDVDEGTLARGAELFDARGCASCHLGEPTLADVGTGGVFKTPSLVGLGMRTVLMHDGCAATIEDRLTGPADCTGGDRHGVVSDLGEDDLAALAAYLRSL